MGSFDPNEPRRALAWCRTGAEAMQVDRQTDGAREPRKAVVWKDENDYAGSRLARVVPDEAFYSMNGVLVEVLDQGHDLVIVAPRTLPNEDGTISRMFDVSVIS